MSNVSRRVFLRGAVLTMGAAMLGAGAAACSSVDQPTPRGYDGDPRPLPIPPLDDGQLRDGTRHFDLTTQAGTSEILPGVTTATWGFNGPLLGPTLHLRRGETTHVDIHNELDEMTTIHWHGMKIPAAADGGPHSPIEPGDTWAPEWRIDQPAATLWYHPHPHGRTGLQCYQGLAGMVIVDDDVSTAVDVPRQYGVDDIPVVIMDAKFTEDGQLDKEFDPDLGLMGDTPVVNGITNAAFDATTRRVRLRIINGANMRFYNLRFSNERPFFVVATDSGLLAEPLEVDAVVMGPGERVEVVVDLEPDTDVTLESTPLASNFGIPADLENAPDFGFAHSFELLTIHGPSADAPEPSALPAQLDPSAAAVPDVTAAPRREFRLDTFKINDQLMDMRRVDVVIDHDGPEVWTVTNDNSDWPHNFHIHNSRFRVLEITGDATEEVATYGWKDTVALPPKSTATLAVEFGYYPDPHVPYMFHCHMLWHEDNGMMGQFVVVEPGDKPDLRIPEGAINLHPPGHQA
ncbi:multicopper oxidase family protein [Corynebacterium uterequi]|uniref:Multicopper oxidase CueO n=1 Tax=Corynebacterium uterequi TaxID=1072256 RepID=A0A0G3HBS8_9CORY|nr:multicopper oxidase domain-containing protein [Corynebacterium uterequi]AKK10754.1 putative multicopper oxidase [Corynebacterium uterequi]